MRSAIAQAAAFLKRRERFTAEVRAHLNGYPLDEVDAAIEQLTMRGFLNDRRTGTVLIASFRGKRAAGDAFITAALERAQCNGEVATFLMEELRQSSPESERVVEAIQSRGSRTSPGTLVRWLASRGFSEETIAQAVPELGEDRQD